MPRFRPLFAATALLAAAPVLPALDPGDLAERWRWRIFDREERLPPGGISAIGHDRDDFIYAGADRGLFRYNGFQWSPVESAEPLEGGPVLRIVEAGGDVYAATRAEVWLARYGVELHRVLKGGRLLLAAGPLGGVYAVDAAAGLHHQLEKEAASRVDEGAALPESEVLDYAVDDRRMHWLATADGPYRRDIRGRLRWQLDPELGPDLRGRPCLRLFVVKRQTIVRAPVAAAQPPAGPVTFELWAFFGERGVAARGPGAAGVLARRGEAGWRTAAVDPSSPAIADLVLDGAGSYLAMSADGRVFLSNDGAAWAPVPALGIGSVAISGGLLDPHGYLWFRGGTNSIVRFDGLSRRWERYDRGLGLPSNNVLCLIEASDGSVWAGTDQGVVRYPPGAPGDPSPTPPPPRALRRITGLAEDRTGKIWISSDAVEGVYFFHEGSWNSFQPAERGADRGIASEPIRRIVADRGGDLWFLAAGGSGPSRGPAPGGGDGARPGHRVYRYSASVYTVSSFRAMELAQGPVNDLLQAQDKAYWFATEEGLVRIAPSEDAQRVYTEADGLRAPRVWAIAEAADGAIWVCYDPSTASGVTRIRGDRVETFDERHGLSSANAWSAACTVSPEGASVWLGTDRGIVRFDGECWYNLPIASLAPQASKVWPLCPAGGRGPAGGESILVGTFGQGIYRFRSDDRRRPRITLYPPQLTRQDVVSFQWDGRDFKNETPPAELRFRTRIDDEPWTPFGPERRRSAAGLTPGEHVFSVEVRDSDGNPNREKSTLRFLVPALPVLFSPLAWAALAGAGGAGVLALLAAVLHGWVRGRAGGPRRAREAARLHAGFAGAALVLDQKGRIAALAGRHPEALGLAADLARELEGRPAALLPVFQGDAARRALARLLLGEALTPAPLPIGPGAERWVRVRGFPLEAWPARGGAGSSGPCALVLVEEVTRERMGDALRERSRRIGALQALAGRIADELEAAGGVARAGELARSLREFAEARPRGREPIALAELLDALLGRATNGERPSPALRVPAGVELDLRGQTGLWTVCGDRGGVELALRAVLENAINAMPAGGRLAVRLRNRRLEGDLGGLAPGPYVEVEVADSGEGSPAAQAERAFEPFSSRTSGGLGLPLAYGIVSGHGGDIRIESAPGAGTTVTVLLPADPGA